MSTAAELRLSELSSHAEKNAARMYAENHGVSYTMALYAVRNARWRRRTHESPFPYRYVAGNLFVRDDAVWAGAKGPTERLTGDKIEAMCRDLAPAQIRLDGQGGLLFVRLGDITDAEREALADVRTDEEKAFDLPRVFAERERQTEKIHARADIPLEPLDSGDLLRAVGAACGILNFESKVEASFRNARSHLEVRYPVPNGGRIETRFLTHLVVIEGPWAAVAAAIGEAGTGMSASGLFAGEASTSSLFGEADMQVVVSLSATTQDALNERRSRVTDLLREQDVVVVRPMRYQWRLTEFTMPGPTPGRTVRL